MVTDAFDALLQELGKVLQVSGLHADAKGCCLLKLKGGIQVQLEVDRSGQSLLIVSELGQIPPGRYKENLFVEALKANGLPPPRRGTFAYSKQADSLVIFEMLELQNLNGQEIANTILPLLEKVRIWKEAITQGNVPVTVESPVKTAPGGIFGLRP